MDFNSLVAHSTVTTGATVLVILMVPSHPISTYKGRLPVSSFKTVVWALLVAACGGGSSGSGPTDVPNNNNPPPNIPSSAAVTMKSEIDNSGYGYGDRHTFDPGSVSITRGGSVTWSNNGVATHNVTFSTKTGAPSNIPDHGSATNSRTFSTAGAFSYQCTNHAGMAGTVTVH